MTKEDIFDDIIIAQEELREKKKKHEIDSKEFQKYKDNIRQKAFRILKNKHSKEYKEIVKGLVKHEN